MAIPGVGNQGNQVKQGGQVGTAAAPGDYTSMPGAPDFAGEFMKIFSTWMAQQAKPADKPAATTNSSAADIAKARAEGEAKGKADAEAAAKGIPKVPDAVVAEPVKVADAGAAETYELPQPFNVRTADIQVGAAMLNAQVKAQYYGAPESDFGKNIGKSTYDGFGKSVVNPDTALHLDPVKDDTTT